MRVLYIVTAFARYEGDVITPWLTQTIRRLKDKGIDVSVFVSSYKGLGDQNLHRIEIKRFRYFFKRWENLTHEETTPDRLKKGIFYKILVLFYLLGGIIGIINLCRRERYEIIHIHWPFPHALFGYFGSRVCKAKLLLSFYGVELRWVVTRMRFFRPLLGWAIDKSDGVTAISSYTAKEIQKIADRRVALIPFGAAITSNQRSEVASRFSAVREPNILFVGRLVERKGVRYLISALKIIGGPATLTIIGEGPERLNLEKLAESKGIKDRINFTGWVNEDELKEYYQRCTLFVLPACIDSKGDTEGLGVVLLEAMMHKKPVIASNVGGIVDIVKDGETGLLVPEKDPERLASAIMEILNDNTLARRLGENGYRFVSSKFDWDKIIDRLISVYSEVLKE